MNEHEAAAREQKAMRLATVLATDPRVAAHPELSMAGADFRAEVARLAGTRNPSEQTWDRAIELARGLLANRQLASVA